MVRDINTTPERGVDSYPLSPMQQGMLFHHLQGGAPGVDVEQVICELHEPVDAAAFENAWLEVVARHAILRSDFEWGHDGPRQVVRAPADVRLDFRHLEFGSEHEALRGLEEYLAADRRAGFPVLTAPLLRIALLRASANHFWFVATMHHLVADTRAMAVMFREALDLHDAARNGERLELPAPRSFGAFIAWLQTQDNAAAAETFWRNQLKGFTTATPLPFARPANPLRDDEDPRGELAFRLGEAETKALRATASRHGVTLNTLVQAAWACVLSRSSGESDVVFGAVRACRHVPVEGAASTVGLFINTVPVRVRVDPAATIDGWLRAIRAEGVAVRHYEHTPLAKVQQWSDVAPGQPLFESVISFQDPSWTSALTALGGKWADRWWDIRSQPNFPVALDVYVGPTLTLKLIYARERFRDDAMARVIGHLREVLQALAAEARGLFARVGELPLLTAAEERQLAGWNRTLAEFPRTRCVHSYLEANAETHPARLAVADSHGSLSHGELNLRANRLAHRLKSLGIGPDSLVAVCMERSVEMIVAWLGVIKAGGAFVPLDPGYPPERLAFQLEDCRAPVLLTQPHLRAVLPRVSAGVTLIELGRAAAELTGPGGNLSHIATPKHLAYVIYTSGSTGVPKGVMIEHRALMNLVTWHQRTYQLTPADRGTHLASPAFDAAVWEIWPYLAIGASVHIPDAETRVSPPALWRWLAAQQITITFLPTPLAEALMNEPAPRPLALRALLTGGDKLKRRPARDFPCALINHYGPTESTVVATCATIGPGDEAVAPSIGRPIANTRVQVLDAQLRPVPVGVTGELFIGGEGLARGYLGRAELTAEKFIADPADAKGEGLRLYRTGDLVRWTTDGELEFLGRIDAQVKIRGHRIEPGEIEAALHSHPAVREALVVARADERGEPQLVGYVRPTADAAAGERELNEFLRAKLPPHMVPSALVLVEAWPLTPNGKIDRRALPAPGAAPRAVEFAAPESAVEETIARVWAELLGRTPIGRHDNFFEIGGHSLLAAQAVSRLNRALDSALSVRAVFDQPTVAGLAQAVETCALDCTTPRISPHRLTRRSARSEMALVPPN